MKSLMGCHSTSEFRSNGRMGQTSGIPERIVDRESCIEPALRGNFGGIFEMGE